MSSWLVTIALLLCSFNALLAQTPDGCQIVDDPGCNAAEKHACKSLPGCDWSHHHFCYRICADYIYYPLNNNANDYSHYHLNGVKVGGQYVADRFNNPLRALEDGIVNVGSVPTPVPLQFQNGFTLAAWIWFANDQPKAEGGWAPIVGNLEYTNYFAGYELWVTTWDNLLRTEFSHEVGIASNTPIPTEQWVHVAMTVTDSAVGQITFYINGIAAGGDIRHYSPNDYSNTKFAIAAQQIPYYDRQTFGRFDDVIAIDHAVTATEIISLEGVNAINAHKAQPLEEKQPRCETSSCEQPAKRKAKPLQEVEHCKTSLCEERQHNKAN